MIFNPDTAIRPTPDLAAALAAFQAEVPAIGKNETATVVTSKGKYSYSYASLGDITMTVLPALGKQGLSFLSMPTLNHDGRFVLRYMLLHSSGGYESGEYPLTGNTPQEIGSAITYARRYCLCSVTGVAPDDDDDGAAASRRPSATPVEYTPSAAEIRSVIATVGKGKGMLPNVIAADFQSWSKGQHIAATEDTRLLGDYLDYLRSRSAESTEDGAA